MKRGAGRGERGERGESESNKRGERGDAERDAVSLRSSKNRN